MRSAAKRGVSSAIETVFVRLMISWIVMLVESALSTHSNTNLLSEPTPGALGSEGSLAAWERRRSISRVALRVSRPPRMWDSFDQVEGTRWKDQKKGLNVSREIDTPL